jgi:general secretion pathway protein K
LQTLQAFVMLLPVRTTVNLNTASPEVLMASVPKLDMARARAMVAARANQHMSSLADADKLVGDASIHFDPAEHSVMSRFFSVTGQLRVGRSTLQEQSVLQRDGIDVKTLSRTREAVSDSLSLLQ